MLRLDCFESPNFAIGDDLNKPSLTLSYIKPKKIAEAARVHVEAALVGAAVDDA